MKNILIILTFIDAIMSVRIEVYPEHNPIDENFDYFHIHLDELDMMNKKDIISNPKIIYKIPKIDHDDIFILKICPSGTIDKITDNKNSNNIILDNCLNDIHGSLIGLNHYSEVPLYQYSMYSYYKTCFFGSAASEAERSLISMPIENIINNEQNENENLFYTNNEEIMEKYEYSSNFNQRLLQSEKTAKDYRCTLEFNLGGLFDARYFEDKVSYIKNNDNVSILVIEYSAEKILPNPKGVQVFEQLPFDKNKDISVFKEEIIRTLNKSLYFQEAFFEKKKLKYFIKTNYNEGFLPILEIKNNNSKTTSKIKDRFLLKTNEYLRFIPMVCTFVLSAAETTSYMFLSSNNCIEATKNKHVIVNNEGKYAFATAREGKLQLNDQVEIDITTMNFKYFIKNEPGVLYSITDLEEKTDIVYDNVNQIIYHLNYQKTNITNEKNKSLSESNINKSEGKPIKIKINGKSKINKIFSETNKAFTIGLIAVFAIGFIIFGIFQSWIAVLKIVIVILCLLAGMSTTTYIKQGELKDKSSEIKNNSSFVNKFMKEHIEEQQKRIKNLSSITPSCFENIDICIDNKEYEIKGSSRIVVNVDTFNTLLKNASGVGSNYNYTIEKKLKNMVNEFTPEAKEYIKSHKKILEQTVKI